MFEPEIDPGANRKFQVSILFGLASIAAVFILITKINAPNIRSVNGAYENPCCSMLLINNGQLQYGYKSLPLKLRKMKFGLTGYVEAEFSRNDLLQSTKSTAILFSRHDRAYDISIPVNGRYYTFKRANQH